MEQKSIFLSALGVGVGVGLGIGLAQSFGRWANLSGYEEEEEDEQIEQELKDELVAKQIEQELKRLMVNGKESTVTFDKFPPYILSKRTRELLTSAADVQLKGYNISKNTRKLGPESKAILLSGPGEFYHQALAKALAHYSESNLLLLDMIDFSDKLQSKYGCTKREPLAKRSISELTLDKMSSFMGSFSMLSQTEVKPKGTSHQQASGTDFKSRNKEVSNSPPRNKRNASADISCGFGIGTVPLIIYLSDVEKFLESERFYKLFQRLLKKLSGPVLILGSIVFEPEDDDCDKVVSQGISALFPHNIEIRPPEDKSEAMKWASQISDAKKEIQCEDNKKHIAEVLAALYIVISSKSLYHALSIFQEGGSKFGPKNKKESEVVPDDEYEKLLRPQVIAADEIGVTFADIGSLDETKESLQELVMLPLRRPDLFQGSLLKPCKGVLLFGPPGTGKTMFAKAIANEAGASFINVSMSTITSNWFGGNEKNVRALFTLAAKVSPTIIFVDEVDGMLGQRTTDGEMRKIQNEFITHWDGLRTKPSERILVLAATNRPFDLDEAFIRRFERRIMVGLPSIESREKILRNLLSKEKTDNLDFHELAQMTEGYTGSDLKNLCIRAAYRPLRELTKQERLRDQEKKKEEEAGKSTKEAGKNIKEPKEEKGKSSEEPKEKEAEVITLRPLNMEDMRIAKNQIASEESGMQELKEWTELYGEGVSRKQEQLSYFL